LIQKLNQNKIERDSKVNSKNNSPSPKKSSLYNKTDIYVEDEDNESPNKISFYTNIKNEDF